jgi:arylsulfatase A
MPTRREFLGSLAAPAIARAARPAQPLNFIFILIDDMGWTDLSCYGSKFYESPNIDRLASEGMRFTNAYAACPVCSPTRASIMTGKYPARLHLTDWISGRKQWPASRLLNVPFEQQLPLAETTMAEMLKPAGYTSASIGKWHLGGEGFSPENQGFDLNVAGNMRGSPTTYFGPFDLPNLKGGTKEDYLTDKLTDKAEEFIEANRSRPFFLYLPEYAVHLPLQAKQMLVARYKDKIRPGVDQNNAVYAAMIHSVDEAVGRLMRKLEDLRIADRTVIFFTSDNGGVRYEGKSKQYVTSNAPLRAGKGHVYEGGIREPLIVKWPGVTKPGSTCDTPVTSVDYLPTIREMAKASGGPVDGVSIAPLLRGQKPPKREALYWHYPHYSNQGGMPAGAVRQGDYKLIEFYDDGRLELYNLKTDIGEKRNLVRREPAKAKDLHEKLKRWRTGVKAAMPEKNPNYDPAKADQGLTGAEPATDPA